MSSSWNNAGSLLYRKQAVSVIESGLAVLLYQSRCAADNAFGVSGGYDRNFTTFERTR